MCSVCYVPDVFATGAALLEGAKSRAPPPRDAISTAERPWARCAELRRRPGSTRWPPGPRRRGPEGRTRARASEGAGRLASSQVLQHVPRRSLSRRLRRRARRGTRREIHRYSRRPRDAVAHYIFSCRAGEERFCSTKGCNAQLARTSNARRAAPMCEFCRRQQLGTNLA